MWSSGDGIVVRYLRAGKVAWARPVTVVEDTAEGSVLFLGAGTPTKASVTLDGVRIPRNTPYEGRMAIPWKLGDSNWGSSQTLLVTRHGARHSIWLFWSESWEFEGWYVNLQEPHVRTPFGFDTVDQVLDIVVQPDLSWSWKDEDELEGAVRAGRFTLEEAREIRAEGERVLALWPFPTGWEEWRPDPSWPVPQSPDGWDE